MAEAKMNKTDALRYFWGKAHPENQMQASDSSTLMHPLIAHVLDVAAVAILLPGSDRLGLDNRQLGMLIALHDIGKLMPSFQKKVPACWPKQGLGSYSENYIESRHDADGFLLLSYFCAEALDSLFKNSDDAQLDWLESEKDQLWRAVAGHHGKPAACDWDKRKQDPSFKFIAPYAQQFIQILLKVFNPPALPLFHSPDCLRRLEWQLAGLTNQADWIGSQKTWFPYVTPDAVMDATAYFWNHALPHAQKAILQAGLGPVEVASFQGIERLFSHIQKPSPVQDVMQSVALPDGPALVIIEDMTGSGKTEAALVTAHRLMASGRASGLFVALPTMATAHAMYDRLVEAYRNLFLPSSRPSLALAHSRALLDERFVSVLAPDDALDVTFIPDDRASAAEICCSAWLGRDSRRALLAQVGVGTIDQALMAVLPVKFATMRQAGLAGKVLLVDECHAYDSYMQEEMAALLRFHAAMGGSAILLSATLTGAVRQKLTTAFQDGLRIQETATLSSAAYPLVTLVGAENVLELPCNARDELKRTVAVHLISDEASVVHIIKDASAKNAAVAWVRNSVDDVIASAQALTTDSIKPIVFHARFAMIDRLAIEREVLRRFGAKSSEADRAAVLIASPVLQESLDIDFDILCTDIAPMDLVIQRSGRLQRHKRNKRPIESEELYILSPVPEKKVDKNWVSHFLPKTAGVYRNAALLWRTADVLKQEKEIKSPENIRYLIEQAADLSDVPEALMGDRNNAEGRGRAEKGLAMQNVLNYEAGYAPDVALWESDIRTPTRLEDEPHVTVRLAIIEGQTVRPWAAFIDGSLETQHQQKRAWALSEVSVRRKQLAHCLIPPEAKEAASRARSVWSWWEREAEDQFLLLLLTPNESGWQGSGRNGKGQDVVIQYDQLYGLQIFPAISG
ncbi:CRISPR-associated helicase Cas3' [Acetobacter indonesiensis]|nr:CRISPR-associated helicase Cas3' [Acetobacter indonesiensis]